MQRDNRGRVYHRMGPLLPLEGRKPGFVQLYMGDNETDNRHSVFSGLSPAILARLQHILHTCNPFVAQFKAHACMQNVVDFEVKIMEAGIL